MKALQFLQPEQRLEVHDVPWPTVSAPHDVIVRVAFAGVCGTDLHALSGHFPMAQRWNTMGHELSGVVAEVGEAVTTVVAGDRVVVDPNHCCGVCRACKLGNVHFCATQGPDDGLGFYRPGGWAEAVLAHEADVHRLPAGPIPAHGRVVVLGAGIIGLLTACLLHHRGVTDVTISEPGPARRRFVDGLRLGYRAAAPAELAAEFAALSDDQVAAEGVDMVIDCSGFCPAIEQAAGWLRRGALAAALGDRYLDLPRLGIKLFKLDQYQEAMDKLKKGEISKAMFAVNDTL
ncbi:Sorbitol dehydrogenase [Amphibalanus amphitrite]|uniref:Sorbitol dehydrogenase n=1 Tax=Amphibalanus amphitrite TaxID=1232801 RepID=A0A6A4UVI5_AMPAM|nr:Sorbitol dehydrogenase [Amphibalanus amphitrite]